MSDQKPTCDGGAGGFGSGSVPADTPADRLREYLGYQTDYLGPDPNDMDGEKWGPDPQALADLAALVSELERLREALAPPPGLRRSTGPKTPTATAPSSHGALATTSGSSRSPTSVEQPRHSMADDPRRYVPIEIILDEAKGAGISLDPISLILGMRFGNDPTLFASEEEDRLRRVVQTELAAAQVPR